MSGKTKGTTRKTTTKARKTASKKTPSKKTASKTTAKVASKPRATKTKTTKPATTKRTAANRKTTTAAVVKAPANTKLAARPSSERSVLTRSELDLSSVIDSLSSQMNTAMATLTNIAVAQMGKAESVMRTAPLDRASSMFQRLVGEVIDEHWADMLPPIVALRVECDDRFNDESDSESDEAEFYERARDMLDQVLKSACVVQYDARVGETYDSVIHQAVGETHREDLDSGVVGELIQAGFRTERGKVVSPAKVKVNRR